MIWLALLDPLVLLGWVVVLGIDLAIVAGALLLAFTWIVCPLAITIRAALDAWKTPGWWRK
jgi:hypothetical protein